MVNLGLTIENLELLIRVGLDDIKSGTGDDDQGKKLTTLALYYRELGVALYLSTGDPASFAGSLAKGVQARLHYLRRHAEGKVPDSLRYNTTLQNRAFFDALAIGDLASASELVRLCDSRWYPDFEYEDDFLFADFLQRFFLVLHDGAGKALAEQNLARLAGVLEGQASPEHDLCAALVGEDAEGFDAAFTALLNRRRAKFKEILTLPPEVVATEKHVFVNGIGIVLLARGAGLATQEEYPTVPRPLLRLPPHARVAPEAWRRLR